MFLLFHKKYCQYFKKWNKNIVNTYNIIRNVMIKILKYHNYNDKSIFN